MTYSPGQVLLICWPNSRRTGRKTRPALVVSSLKYNQQGSDVICACITSNTSRPPEGEDLPVPDTDPEFLATRLRYSSMVRCGKLFTFDCSDQHSTLGRFTSAFMDRVKARILSVIQGTQGG